ncbi:MAG: glycoside hydrolase family 3 C-terminal domain-containing protein, partial [Lachnospiraceae bacterium]|nr:glycoside hydrolase family 3 C-terminal domain-containing protein [Lachnospiraceae bacterium]
IAGLELEMPGPSDQNAKRIVNAVKAGELEESKLDTCVERILKVIYSYVEHRDPNAVFDRDADHIIATNMETECAVLLQNNGILPVSPDRKVCYIGEFAEKPRYQGGGSSHINSSKVTSALDSAKAKGRNVTYVRGFSSTEDLVENDEIAKATKAAQEAEIAIIFAGLPDRFESEGYDRKTMALPECQLKMIQEVVKVQPNTVVVLHNGSPVECPWADQVSAILEMYLGGQGVGEATDQLLYGEANPSGHLAETFPYKLEDNPSYLNFPGDGKTVDYAEGIYVGYRYYDKKKMPVRWAFGHGLSYTSFAMSNIRVDQNTLDDDGKVTVSVDVTNQGKVAGKEVVQLYIKDKNGTLDRPEKELKGFEKVSLNPGETKTVSLCIDARALSYYSESLQDWFAPSGTYELLIGDSSDNILQCTEISFSTRKVLPLLIDRTTTIGELLADERTAPCIREIMSNDHSGFLGANEKDDSPEKAVSNEMLAAMVNGLPIKSMASFGIISGDEIDSVVEKLKACVK